MWNSRLSITVSMCRHTGQIFRKPGSATFHASMAPKRGEGAPLCEWVRRTWVGIVKAWRHFGEHMLYLTQKTSPGRRRSKQTSVFHKRRLGISNTGSHVSCADDLLVRQTAPLQTVLLWQHAIAGVVRNDPAKGRRIRSFPPGGDVDENASDIGRLNRKTANQLFPVSARSWISGCRAQSPTDDRRRFPSPRPSFVWRLRGVLTAKAALLILTERGGQGDDGLKSQKLGGRWSLQKFPVSPRGLENVSIDTIVFPGEDEYVESKVEEREARIK